MNINEKVDFKNLYNFKSFIQLLVGIGLIVFAIRGFIMPNHLLDGGIIGITILAHELIGLNISLGLFIGNIGFLIFAYKKISNTLAIKSLITIIILALGLEFVQIPAVTEVRILVSLFGGALLGIGIGLVIRTGGVVDGIEILIVQTKKRIGLSMSELIIIINSTLFLIIAIALGFEVAMFSIITYVTAAKVIDYVVDGLEYFIALTIISGESEAIKRVIVNDFKKGITVYKGERGYLPGKFEESKECDIIVTVVTRLELLHIKKAILMVDPKAFMHVNRINEANGGILKKFESH